MCHAIIRTVCYVCEKEMGTRTKPIDCLPIVSRPAWGSAISNLEHHRAKRFKQTKLCSECGEWHELRDSTAEDNLKAEESSPSGDEPGERLNNSKGLEVGRNREAEPASNETAGDGISVFQRKISARYLNGVPGISDQGN